MNKYSRINVEDDGRSHYSSYYDDFTCSKAFFNDSIKNKTNNIEKHHEEIFDIYDKWANKDDKNIMIPDFTTSIISRQSPKILPEIDENDKEPNITEMSIIHLKSHPNTFKKYEQIIEAQRKLEKDLKEVTEFIKEEIKSILKLDDNNKIDELVYYYQNKIQDYRGYQEGFDYKKEDFEETYNFMSKDLKVPLPEKDELIKQHIISIYPKVIDKLCKLNDYASKLINLDYEFNESLQSVIATKSLGLKGKCIIEEKLSSSYKFKQFFKRKKNVP